MARRAGAGRTAGSYGGARHGARHGTGAGRRTAPDNYRRGIDIVVASIREAQPRG